MKIGTCCPVWKETRYLPLVLEQMSLCPGPKLLLWQDQPLYWLGNGAAPSGHLSEVGMMAAEFPEIEVVTMDHAPRDGEDAPFGGFASLAEMAFARLRAQGVEVVIWTDSDWLFRLADIKDLYARIEASSEPKYWAVKGKHYWRNFRATMDTGDITAGFPIQRPNLWHPYDESEMIRTEIICHHAAYVLTNHEMYDKVHSWGHAPLFKERGFYEKEWLAHNDTLVKPQPADPPPDEILTRIRTHNGTTDPQDHR